jgi:deoxyadenosine/deoxycytidine kinase
MREYIECKIDFKDRRIFEDWFEFEFRIWKYRIDSENRKVFEDLVKLISSELKYQSKEIDAENNS